MKKLFWDFIKLSPIVVAAAFATSNSVFAAEMNESVTPVNQLSEQKSDNNMAQVTSVSQFSDVQPTDWAFQALQSLVERYGCIAGYPNGTFRGNRAMTRYEFAAGLNACLDRVNELIATATADLVKKEDLAALQRLQEEFSAELATLRGRVDALEARTAELEANQFSTTTKLQGEAIFSLSEVFGDTRAGGANLDSNTVFSNRVRLSLNSSFTGKDQLQIRLQSRNTTPNNGVTGTNMTRLSYDGDEANDTVIDKINYSFNLTDAVRVKVDANNAELYSNINNFNPDFASDGRGSISRYGRFSPIYRQSQGGAAVTVQVNPTGPISLSAAYVAPRASNPNSGFGVFDGDSTIFGQIEFKPSKQLGLAFAYANTYDGAKDGSVNLFQSTGSTFANRPFGNVATSSNNYGVQASFSPSPQFSISGWAGFSNVEAKAGANRGAEADVFYWMANLGLRDFGSKGSLLGFAFGQPPKVTGINRGLANTDRDESYHLEALYRLQLNNNISVTPALLVIFNPENNNNNDTIYVGTLRTTFTF
jgi:Carbohydrate-selective porin, OprB family/S-layer homology domain